MRCKSCGTANDSSASFCQNCGTETTNEKEPTNFLKDNIEHQSGGISENLENTTGIPSKEQGSSIIENTHYWRRFFARSFDLYTLGVLGSIAFIFFFATFFSSIYLNSSSALENPIFFAILLYLVWMPVEAGFISTTGTTPGKWIFGISVLDNDRNRLTYMAALKRTCLVWVQGDGFGIPPIPLFTRYFAYRRLVKTGSTLWDDSIGSLVIHKKWGVLRTVSCFFVGFATLMLIGILNGNYGG
jgi:uncharacterized RDD family membrane protein YckC